MNVHGPSIPTIYGGRYPRKTACLGGSAGSVSLAPSRRIHDSLLRWLQLVRLRSIRLTRFELQAPSLQLRRELGKNGELHRHPRDIGEALMMASRIAVLSYWLVH